MRRAGVISSILLALFLLAGTALGQDAGIPDTVRAGKVATNAGLKVGLPVTAYTDNPIAGYSIGLTWNSSAITYDSVSYIGTRLPPGSRINPNVDNINRRILVGFADFSAENPLTPGDGLLYTIWYTVSGAAADQFVIFDSTFVPPAGDFEMSPQVGNGFRPQFKAGEIKIGNPQPPAIIQLSQPSFTFNGQVGQGNPPSQIQNITNIGGQTLNWTSTKLSSWLVLSPSTGTAPTAMVVSVNTASLGAGTFYDTVSISAGNASNSPQKFVVTLNMTIPPPTIQLVPDSLRFQGLENGTNPAGQAFAINNIGQGILNWTATETAGWFSLSAYNGTAPSNVTVNIDNTGLTAGVYVDSILISDPTATNSPRRVKVVFELFSAFPVIEFSPDSIFVVGSDTQDPASRILYIENNGGGVMNWTLTKKTSWLTLSTNSGTAEQGTPAPVTLTFNRNLVDFGKNYDTITISSNNAINSPRRVAVTFWKMEVPQNLTVSRSSLSFIEVECGSYPGIPAQTFTVNQAVSFPPLNWSLTYTQPWLVVTPTAAANPSTVTVRVLVEGLSPGIYRDTIVVSSDVSLDPPRRIPVTFTVSPTPGIAELYLSQDSLLYLYKYTQLGSALQSVAIFNIFGGCVDWTASGDVAWLTPIPTSGTTLDSIAVRTDPVGLSLGRHTGNLVINSSTATNTPFTMPVVVWIYTFGDANGNGIVNVSDVTYLINYIFAGGPAPVPLFITGDVNCDRETNVADVVYLINWIYLGGPEPCLY